MTERKPAKLDFESWIDKQIREATARGEFENLPGAGKPIPRGSDDENWWLKGYLRKEGVRGDALLPPSLLLRRDIERLPETVRELNSEREVRETVRELNERVVDWLRLPHGPYVRIAPVDTEEIVEQWRAERRPKRSPDTSASTPSSATRTNTTSWWRRLFRSPDAAPSN
ncbi:DnaJ family domain-containing protein [Nocardia sp. XZ_19_369]|uniref:DnaJ family domain-containing protein n=1 Tax=Nocardia sp. XZ_19_369 TaxID=2769487 RepID=UPI001E5EE82B|nr:DnaJ family domain-containing protein [Nocardia sp. XZ_19_369]